MKVPGCELRPVTAGLVQLLVAMLTARLHGVEETWTWNKGLKWVSEDDIGAWVTGELDVPLTKLSAVRKSCDPYAQKCSGEPHPTPTAQ